MVLLVLYEQDLGNCVSPGVSLQSCVEMTTKVNIKVWQVLQKISGNAAKPVVAIELAPDTRTLCSGFDGVSKSAAVLVVDESLFSATVFTEESAGILVAAIKDAATTYTSNAKAHQNLRSLRDHIFVLQTTNPGHLTALMKVIWKSTKEVHDSTAGAGAGAGATAGATASGQARLRRKAKAATKGESVR